SDASVLGLRRRQAKNFLAILLLSRGVPMLLAGDEVLRSQHGNNNAYCQDNELGWVDWSLADRNAPLVDFVRQLVDLRRSRLWLRRDTFLKGTRRGGDAKDVTWLHPAGHEMSDADWNDSKLRSLAVLLNGAAARKAGGDLLVVFNADDVSFEFRCEAPVAGGWILVFDTGSERPADARRQISPGAPILVGPHSVLLLETTTPD
ncbi:MAG: glycogen debranching enzyme, partial [Steroidobacteraceae bacterium]